MKGVAESLELVHASQSSVHRRVFVGQTMQAHVLILPVAGHTCWLRIQMACCMRTDPRVTGFGVLHQLHRWGFNRFSQLGVGEGMCHNRCNMAPRPIRVMLFPGCTKIIAAAGNSSAAVRSEDGMLFTWGSNEAGRLGHKVASEVLSVHKPEAVNELRGKRISSVAIMRDGGFAFVPSSIEIVEPPLLPMTGGTKMVLRGGGLWDSSNCIVKFIPLGTNNQSGSTRASVGKCAPTELSKDKRPGVHCRLPRFTYPCDVVVEVAMNGKDFTRSNVRVRVYREPVLSKVLPLCCSSTCTSKVEISGYDLFESGFITVRFRQPGMPGQEWTVPGSFSCVVSDGDGKVTCRSPLISKGDFPIKARVSVALNSIDFTTLPGELFVFHNATISQMVPDCRPLNHQFNETLTSRMVYIKGKSFFDSKEMIVKLSAQYGEESFRCTVSAQYVDDENLSFIVPSAGELLPVPGKCDECPPEWQKSCFCRVELSLDGIDFLDKPIPLVLYREFDSEDIVLLGPMSGPSCGGTKVVFQLPPWLVNLEKQEAQYGCASVRLVPAKSDVSDPSSLIVPMQSETHQGNRLTFISPAIHVPIKDICCDVNDDVHETEDPVPHNTEVQSVEMKLQMALDGHDFRPLSRRFSYYPSPVVLSIKTNHEQSQDVPTAKSGTEVYLHGTNFFHSDLIKVKISEAGGLVMKDTILNAAFSGDMVRFEMPQLPIRLQRNTDGVAADSIETEVVIEVAFNGVDFSSDVRSLKYRGVSL